MRETEDKYSYEIGIVQWDAICRITLSAKLLLEKYFFQSTVFLHDNFKFCYTINNNFDHELKKVLKKTKNLITCQIMGRR